MSSRWKSTPVHLRDHIEVKHPFYLSDVTIDKPHKLHNLHGRGDVCVIRKEDIGRSWNIRPVDLASLAGLGGAMCFTKVLYRPGHDVFLVTDGYNTNYVYRPDEEFHECYPSIQEGIRALKTGDPNCRDKRVTLVIPEDATPGYFLGGQWRPVGERRVRYRIRSKISRSTAITAIKWSENKIT